MKNKPVEDIARIWDYIDEAWSENQADKYYELIISVFEEIVENPVWGKSYAALPKEIVGLK